jgi:hypothetical protein
VKAVLALETVRRKREGRYDRYVRSLDRKRDEVAVAARLKALNRGQLAEAQRIVASVRGTTSARGPAIAGHDRIRRRLADDLGAPTASTA